MTVWKKYFCKHINYNTANKNILSEREWPYSTCLVLKDLYYLIYTKQKWFKQNVKQITVLITFFKLKCYIWDIKFHALCIRPVAHEKLLNLSWINFWKRMSMCSYLYERVPMCDGFSWVCQHFIPVFSAQTLSIIPYSAHANDLIVTNTVKERAIYCVYFIILLFAESLL